jgi:hypothetical protein
VLNREQGGKGGKKIKTKRNKEFKKTRKEELKKEPYKPQN